MKLMLLLGSGTSYASFKKKGKDSTVEGITEKILQGSWRKTTWGTFAPGKPEGDWDFARAVQEFLLVLSKFLKRQSVESGLVTSENPNYEDLYEALREIETELTVPEPFGLGLMLNGLFESFESTQEWSRLTEVWCGVGRSPLRRDDVVDKAMRLIESAVTELLCDPEEVLGLDLIRELHRWEKVERLDIATTNHDRLVEKALQVWRIPYVDGFGDWEGDVAFFDPRLFDNPGEKPRLFKLHGSIDWVRCRTEGESDFWAKSRYVYRGQRLAGCGSPLNYTPLFITGRDSKLGRYNFGIYRRVFRAFDRALDHADCLITSGYGWGDRGIDTRLVDWLDERQNKRLVYLNKNGWEELSAKRLRSEIARRSCRFEKDGKFVVVKKWFSEATLNDIQEACGRQLAS